jgi:hypothetical protein
LSVARLKRSLPVSVRPGSSCRLSIASRAALNSGSPVRMTKLPQAKRAHLPEKMRVYFWSRVARVSSFSVSRRRKSR